MTDIFDIVIVGAGTAGCVLAEKLSQDPGSRVLLLEAGEWDKNPLIAIPMGAGKLHASQAYYWGDVSDPDPNLGDRPQEIPHGKVVGGGGSLNFLAHIRGHPSDFDDWEKAGVTGWGFRDVLPWFRKCESWEGGADRWRGSNGPIGVSRPPMGDPIYAAWFAMLRAGGYSLSDDHNGADSEGFGPLQYAVRDGQRSSSAKACLRPALKRGNLKVIVGAHVTRLTLEGRRVTGVEYRQEGNVRRAIARSRTVLCGGAINTPHLLMLSGIGPGDHLREQGIAVVADLPVGKGLEDHLGTYQLWSRKGGASHLQRNLRFDRAAINMALAHVLRRGPSSHMPSTLVGWLRSRPDLARPDLQLFLQLPPPGTDIWFPGFRKRYEDGFGIRVQLVGQQSRGEVLLRSPDPMDRPRIIYNSLSAPGDIVALRHGFRRAQAMANAPEMDAYRHEARFPAQALEEDGAIDDFIRATAIQLYHPAATCPMGGEGRSVLDSDMAVRGVEGLNVVDASAMPRLVSVNPNFTIMMMAAKAAAAWARR